MSQDCHQQQVCPKAQQLPQQLQVVLHQHTVRLTHLCAHTAVTPSKQNNNSNLATNGNSSVHFAEDPGLTVTSRFVADKNTASQKEKGTRGASAYAST